jgi:hypothetical protein
MYDRFKSRVWSKIYNCFVDVLGVEQIYRSKYFPIWQKGDLLGMHKQDDVITEQCTGLKDKNGKLIFEGDIVLLTLSRNYRWCKKVTKLQVRWNTFNCCGFGFGAIGNLTEKCAKNCVVIGNIHENPELLEVNR